MVYFSAANTVHFFACSVFAPPRAINDRSINDPTRRNGAGLHPERQSRGHQADPRHRELYPPLLAPGRVCSGRLLSNEASKLSAGRLPRGVVFDCGDSNISNRSAHRAGGACSYILETAPVCDSGPPVSSHLSQSLPGRHAFERAEARSRQSRPGARACAMRAARACCGCPLPRAAWARTRARRPAVVRVVWCSSWLFEAPPLIPRGACRMWPPHMRACCPESRAPSNPASPVPGTRLARA